MNQFQKINSIKKTNIFGFHKKVAKNPSVELSQRSQMKLLLQLQQNEFLKNQDNHIKQILNFMQDKSFLENKIENIELIMDFINLQYIDINQKIKIIDYLIQNHELEQQKKLQLQTYIFKMNCNLRSKIQNEYLYQYLKQYDFFNNLNLKHEEIIDIIGNSQYQKYNENHVLYNFYDYPDKFYVQISGSIFSLVQYYNEKNAKLNDNLDLNHQDFLQFEENLKESLKESNLQQNYLNQILQRVNQDVFQDIKELKNCIKNQCMPQNLIQIVYIMTNLRKFYLQKEFLKNDVIGDGQLSRICVWRQQIAYVSEKSEVIEIPRKIYLKYFYNQKENQQKKIREDLQKIKLFSNFEIETLNYMIEYCSYVTLQKNFCYQHQNQEFNAFLGILEGQIIVKQKNLNIIYLEESNYFGEQCILPNNYSNYEYIGNVNGQLLQVDLNQFFLNAQTSFDLKDKLYKIFKDRNEFNKQKYMRAYQFLHDGNKINQIEEIEQRRNVKCKDMPFMTYINSIRQENQQNENQIKLTQMVFMENYSKQINQKFKLQGNEQETLMNYNENLNAFIGSKKYKSIQQRIKFERNQISKNNRFNSKKDLTKPITQKNNNFIKNLMDEHQNIYYLNKTFKDSKIIQQFHQDQESQDVKSTSLIKLNMKIKNKQKENNNKLKQLNKLKSVLETNEENQIFNSYSFNFKRQK